MPRPNDSFWFDLMLRRVDGDPSEYTTAFGIVPRFSREAGRTSRGIPRKFTVWSANLAEGCGQDEEFSGCLKSVLAVLEKNKVFLYRFTEDGGEALLTINHTIPFHSGVLSEITLEPAFLLPLAKLGIALKLRGWSSEDWPAIESEQGTFEEA